MPQRVIKGNKLFSFCFKLTRCVEHSFSRCIYYNNYTKRFAWNMRIIILDSVHPVRLTIMWRYEQVSICSRKKRWGRKKKRVRSEKIATKKGDWGRSNRRTMRRWRWGEEFNALKMCWNKKQDSSKPVIRGSVQTHNRRGKHVHVHLQGAANIVQLCSLL